MCIHTHTKRRPTSLVIVERNKNKPHSDAPLDSHQNGYNEKHQLQQVLLRPWGNRKTHTLLVEMCVVHSLEKQIGSFLNIKHTTSHFTLTWNFAQEKLKCMSIQRWGHQCSQHLLSTVMLTEPHSICNSPDYSSPGVEGRISVPVQWNTRALQ